MSDDHAKESSGDEGKMDQRDEPQADLWYHFLAKGWECPGHDDSYESSSCIGAVYVG